MFSSSSQVMAATLPNSGVFSRVGELGVKGLAVAHHTVLWMVPQGNTEAGRAWRLCSEATAAAKSRS